MEGVLLQMSRKELTRLEVIHAVELRQMRQSQAALRLGLSVRQIKRLCQAYREERALGLVSKRRGRISNRRIPEAERERVLALVRQHYPDFGPTLAAEYLSREYGFARSVETLRGWMIEAGIWRAKKAARKRVHPPRERRPRLGELIQIDGSPHDWFEGRAPRCCLIAFIDDATSRVMWARFSPVESTSAYLEGLAQYVSRYGVPAACYSDRHSIFTKHDPEDPAPTQFERAVRALGAEAIQASTPQAKGRIERLFLTLQDRLVKAMRLGGISDIDAANAFLDSHIARHNARFAESPALAEDAHLLWRQGEEALGRICALHHVRTLSKNLVLQFRGQRYIVLVEQQRPRLALRQQKVTVCEHLDGRVELLYQNKALPYRLFDERRDCPVPADGKLLNARVDQALARRAAPPWTPPRSHPWRQGPVTAGR